MSHPAVDAVLDFVKDNWQAGNYSDIPVERIDRDNSELLDDDIRSHTSDLQASNYIGATFADRENDPIGTEYDHRVEIVVGVRIEGLHHTEHGHVDPGANLPPRDAGDPVPWWQFVDEVRDAILRDRTFPETRRDIGYKDLFLTNEGPQSADFTNYYRHDFDVVLSGFETLP